MLLCNSAEPARGNLVLAQLRRPPPPDGEVRLGPRHAWEDRAGRARHAANCLLGRLSPAPSQHRGCRGLGSSLRRMGARAGTMQKPSMTLCLLWTEVKEATFFVHQEKGTEERLDSEVTEFIFISPKVVSVSDSCRKLQSLDFPECAASTANSLWTPRVHDETIAFF